MTTARDDLNALFDAERTARKLHGTLLERPRAELVTELKTAVKAALAIEDDEQEASLRLCRLGVVLGDLEGDETVDLLIDILGSDVPEARIVAGEALEGLAFDRFKEVAVGIERALARLPKESAALSELPFLLAEVGEPGCAKLIGRFLELPDPNAVASAIEALAELGDPAAIPLLTRLEKDGRQVQLDDEDGGERVAIGDLAHEARELLTEVSAGPSFASENGAKKGGGRPPTPRR